MTDNERYNEAMETLNDRDAFDAIRSHFYVSTGYVDIENGLCFEIADRIAQAHLFNSGELLEFDVLHEVECRNSGFILWLGYYRVADTMILQSADGAGTVGIRMSRDHEFGADDEYHYDYAQQRITPSAKFIADWAMTLKLALPDADDYGRYFYEGLKPTGRTRPLNL